MPTSLVLVTCLTALGCHQRGQAVAEVRRGPTALAWAKKDSGILFRRSVQKRTAVPSDKRTTSGSERMAVPSDFASFWFHVHSGAVSPSSLRTMAWISVLISANSAGLRIGGLARHPTSRRSSPPEVVARAPRSGLLRLSLRPPRAPRYRGGTTAAPAKLPNMGQRGLGGGRCRILAPACYRPTENCKHGKRL